MQGRPTACSAGPSSAQQRLWPPTRSARAWTSRPCRPCGSCRSRPGSGSAWPRYGRSSSESNHDAPHDGSVRVSIVAQAGRASPAAAAGAAGVWQCVAQAREDLAAPASASATRPMKAQPLLWRVGDRQAKTAVLRWMGVMQADAAAADAAATDAAGQGLRDLSVSQQGQAPASGDASDPALGLCCCIQSPASCTVTAPLDALGHSICML